MVTKEKTKKTEGSKASEIACGDTRCAIHGELKIRGRIFEGIVISDKMQRTVTVEWPRLSYLPKFERYEKRRSRVKAHNPPCIAAKEGDKVRIAECRPLAKTVKFVVIEKMSGAAK
ncbi:MAG: 30S ribosomal protein S17 [Candidatus Nanoarchaeia archaeon]